MAPSEQTGPGGDARPPLEAGGGAPQRVIRSRGLARGQLRARRAVRTSRKGGDLPFRPVLPKVPPREDTLLYVETALWQWMQPSDWEPLARAFAAWIHARNRPRLLIKTHPSYPACPLLRSLLPPFEVVYPDRSIEQVAPEIDAAEVVGTCCTGLVTLRFLRPDISIVDLGSDIYIPKAYHGDWSSVELMRRVGVKVIASADSPVVKEKSEGHSTGVNTSAGRRT